VCKSPFQSFLQQLSNIQLAPICDRNFYNGMPPLLICLYSTYFTQSHPFCTETESWKYFFISVFLLTHLDAGIWDDRTINERMACWQNKHIYHTGQCSSDAVHLYSAAGTSIILSNNLFYITINTILIIIFVFSIVDCGPKNKFYWKLPSSWIYYCVVPIWTNVSEECITSTFRVGNQPSKKNIVLTGGQAV
jgi:hypothetical protein